MLRSLTSKACVTLYSPLLDTKFALWQPMSADCRDLLFHHALCHLPARRETRPNNQMYICVYMEKCTASNKNLTDDCVEIDCFPFSSRKNPLKLSKTVCLPIFLPIRILIDRNFFEQSRLVLIRYDTWRVRWRELKKGL